MTGDQHFVPTTGRHESSSDPAGQMLTAKELQQLLKISAKTIYSYTRRGLIPYVRIQSNLRFPKKQIQEWIERQTYRPRPPR